MKNIIFILSVFYIGTIYSQTYQDTICWVWVNDVQYEAVSGENFSVKSDLNSIFNANHVVYYEKALPFSTTPELHKIHEIRCNRNGHIDDVINDLITSYSGTFDRFSKFEVMDSVYVYDPVDYMWVEHANDWLWHLKLIKADFAWDITRGDPEIKIAVIDFDFDVTHPDLASEIIPHNDPYSGYQYSCNTTHGHGTTVASFASAETTEQGGTPQGQLASVGFNTKIIGYLSGSRQANLAKALHACNVMGADVMVSCAGGSLHCSPSPNTGEELIVKEILNNGMSIVMPAGNGLDGGAKCGIAPLDYHAFYPFNPEYDDRIIIVTSTDFDDYHYWETDLGIEKTHSHFPEVDICAPGYLVMGAKVTECGANIFPYFGSFRGTSFSSPIVAGVVGLLKSINKDFTPGEIQEIIKSTADPVTDAQSFEGLIGAGRINAFAAVDLAANCDVEVITGIETWYGDKVILCGLIIEDGAVLTISSKVKSSHRSKIIVKPGGKLTIDGGVLTSLDNIPWQGIEVWGDPLAAQHTPLYHGMVQIINGGRIENAVIGVRAGSTDTPAKGGGIVLATDAEFVNNRTCVVFDPYSFTNTGNFSNCTFIRSDDLLGQGDQGVFSLVKLNNVDDVTFSNCNFINDTDFDYVGSGIESFNSIFRLLGECTSPIDCTAWDHGSFTNLEYGIYATATNATDFAYIKHSDFTDNYKGVYLSGMTGALVTDCNFEVNTPFVTDGGYGMYLDNSTGYTIEENTFYHNGASRTGVGLIVNNSGGAPNEIYRNWFTGLQQGISAQELNRNFMVFTPQGLQILCCEFEDCDADILVPRSSLTQWGIAPGQGANSTNPLYMTGNLFDIHSQTPDSDFDDINNEGAHFTYYYPLNTIDYDVLPVDYTQSTVTLFGKSVTEQWTFPTGCPPTQTGGGGGSESAMSENLMETRQMIDSTEQIYAMLVDGGNTESLYDEVYNSASPQTMQLYNELMGKSPYLSDTVVGATIEKEDVIPGAMLRDIMVANPHTAKSDNLLEKVDSRFDPLPDYMKAQILAGRSLVSLKEELESNISRYHLQKSRLMNRLIHYYLNADNLTGGSDSVINLLQTDGELDSKYRLAMKHIETGNTTQALSVLNALPAQYNLQGQQLTRHQEMIDFCTLAIQMATQAGGWQQATEAQVQQLYTLLQSATLVSAYARNALLMLGELSYVEPVIVPDLLKSARAETAYRELLVTKAPPMLEVHPNPAKDFVIVGWMLDSEQVAGSIAIRHITGGLMASFTVNTPVDKQTVDTREWPSGAYVITLSLDGKVIESAKFTLVK